MSSSVHDDFPPRTRSAPPSADPPLSTRAPKPELTADAFQRLLERLSPDRESAGDEYERIRRTLLAFFGWRGSAQPGRAADETLDRVARKLAEGEAVERLEPYIYGVARRVLSEDARQSERERARLSRWQADLAARSTHLEEAHLACAEHCLSLLGSRTRALLAEYHGLARSPLESRQRMAERHGITYGALRVRVHRVRAQVEVCLRECLRRKGLGQS